jgi:hypothetical protein
MDKGNLDTSINFYIKSLENSDNVFGKESR